MEAQPWHPEDIKAAVRKKGKTLRQLSLENGFSESAIRIALKRPLYGPEQVIAAFLGTPAKELWPDRYNPDGTPKRLRARRNPSHRRRGRHGLKRGAA